MVKEFATIGELIQDQVFVNEVEIKLKELKKNRQTRPEPKPGYHYKRDWYDRMRDAGQLNAEFFLANIEDIWFKRSKLSSEVRNTIQYVCETALTQTHIHYGQINEAEAAEAEPKAEQEAEPATEAV